MKTLKVFKHNVVMDLIEKFLCRKRAKKATTGLSRFPSNSANIYQVTQVPCPDRGKCKLFTKRKIDFRTCIRFNDCDLFLCQNSKKTTLVRGSLILKTKFCCKV